MKAEVVDRVKRFYTWGRITDIYCELIALAGSKSRTQSGIIHSAPLHPSTQLPADRTK
jgi:hypothetical protein